jgi:sulfide:quinone oxidoreductase
LTAVAGAAAVTGVALWKVTRSRAKGRVVVVGGGAAGLSVAAQLSLALSDPDITLIDPADRQYYQPGFTLIASGVYAPGSVWKPQADCIPRGVKWVKDTVLGIDPDKKTVRTQASGEIAYDFLVLAPGLQVNWSSVEGITQEAIGQGDAYSIYDFEGAQKTWQGLQAFGKKGGKGVFADTYTKHKCGGAPKKICLLTEDYLRKHGTRDASALSFYTASKELYDVPYYTPRLLEIYKERNVPIGLQTRLRGVDTAAKKAFFERTILADGISKNERFTEDYDFLHFTPPQTAPDFVRQSGLSGTEGVSATEGWAETDKATLVHPRYASSIVCLGDVSGVPTSKTSAAIRKQAPVATQNLICLMEGRAPTAQYNGYAACPIITEYGKLLLCEFGYDKKPLTSFPFNLIDTSKETRAGWNLKVHVLKPLYFYGMITGWA